MKKLLFLFFSTLLTANATSILVTTVVDGEPESLRSFINQATAGDTIFFSTVIESKPQILESSLTIDKDLVLIGGETSEPIITFQNSEVNQIKVQANTNVYIFGVDFFGVNNPNAAGTIVNNGNLTLDACFFFENTGFNGGAIRNFRTLTIRFSSFVKNNAVNGGAIYNDATLRIENSTFDENNAINGGAIFNDATLRIEKSTFDENNADRGGAINNAHILHVKECSFTTNTSGAGGAIWSENRNPVSQMYISNSSFKSNSANLGGAIACNICFFEIENCDFKGNSATFDSGALHLKNVRISSSFTVSGIRGCLLSGNKSERDGGAIFGRNGSVLLESCSIVSNRAANLGAGIFKELLGIETSSVLVFLMMKPKNSKW